MLSNILGKRNKIEKGFSRGAEDQRRFIDERER